MKRWLPWIFVLLLVISSADLSHAKSVGLSWDPSPTPTVTGYMVLTSVSPAMESPLVQDVGDALSTTVNELEDQDDHYFCVKAYDADGNKSVCSNVVNSPPLPETLLPQLDFEVDIRIMP